jgi:hypothetical protein
VKTSPGRAGRGNISEKTDEREVLFPQKPG